MGEKYRLGSLHVQYVAVVRLRRKGGKGVYTYQQE